MKILIISNSIWNIYNFRFSLLREISKKNNLIVYCDKRKKKKLLFKNKIDKFKIYNLPFSSKSTNFFDNLKLLLNLYKIIKFVSPSLIYSFTLKPNLYCGFLALIFNFRFYPTISGLGSAYNRGGFFFLLIKFFLIISFFNAKKIFVHNQNEKNLISKIIIKKKKIIVLRGSGINLQRYSKKKLIKKNYNNNFLYIGRLLKDKGVIELLEAFKNLDKSLNPKLTLSLIIDEDNSSSISIKYIKKITIGYNIDIKINFKNIKKLISNHDCIVLPSYSEGMSRSIMEAASLGRPIICSNISGCKEMVKNNFNGFLVKPKSINSLVKAMSDFTSLSFKKKKTFASNSRLIIENNFFDEKYVNNQYLKEIYNENK